MEKDNNKNKRVIVIVISILLVIILVLGLTFAYLRTELSGSEQIVKVGTLDLILDETSEGISLDNAIGLSDNKGMSTTPSTFELKNNGSKAVDYIIYLDDNTIEETDTRIDDKYLKYNLNKNGEDSGATLLTSIGSNPNRVLDMGTIEGKSTNKYSLNLWITDEVDGNYSGHVFSGKLRVEVSQKRPGAGETIIANLTSGDTFDDGVDTFITGEDPNNYIWYSGKLWRAVSVNNKAKTTKLVTQWNISATTYNPDNQTNFAGSYMEEWLNDTSIDGFLGNLRDYENFIVTDAKWNATLDATSLGSITRPRDDGTIVTDAVGLLNMYEYQSSNNGSINGYLNNGLYWWTLTPYNSSGVRCVYSNGDAGNNSPSGSSNGVRPSINLKSSVRIADGDGTIDNPYRLNGDNDTNLSGTLLSSRYSGEYIRFGNDENNLYRIVSHENGSGTKIVSAQPLKSSGNFLSSVFDSNSSVSYSSSNTIGAFLNGEYLTNYVDTTYSDMIEDSTTWYLGTVGSGTSYKLAKYTDTNMSSTTSSTIDAKVGLLRFGELMAGQFDRNENNTNYWTLTPYNTSIVRDVYSSGIADYTYPTGADGVRPSINLKSNVQIINGDGTKERPFEIALQ